MSTCGSVLCQIRLCERCSGGFPWGKQDSSSLCIKCFNNFKWKQQTGTICGIHSCSTPGVSKIHGDYIYLCRAADNWQHSRWCSLSQVQMLLSWQGDGNSWLDVTSCSSYSEFCPSPFAGHTADVLSLGTDARPAAAQGCVLIPGTAPERVLLARESSGLSCWAKIRGAAPFCVSYPANPLCVTLSFKAAPLTQNCCGGLWVFLLFVRKGRWFLNDTQLERCLGTGHQSSQLFGSLACRETDGSQESKWLLTT